MGESSQNIQTLAETIIWLAEERFKREGGQDINSAIHAVCLEADQLLMVYIAEDKGNLP